MLSQDFLTPSDLEEFIEDASQTKLQAIIDDVWAEVLSEVPSLENAPAVSSRHSSLLKAIMRAGAIRHDESRAGAIASAGATSGTYSENVALSGKGLFATRQLKQLSEIENQLSQATSGARLKEIDLFANVHPYRDTLWTVIEHRSFP